MNDTLLVEAQTGTQAFLDCNGFTLDASGEIIAAPPKLKTRVKDMIARAESGGL